MVSVGAGGRSGGRNLPADQVRRLVVEGSRTYDQIFGSAPGGRGDRRLQIFDDEDGPGVTGGVPPSAHALAVRDREDRLKTTARLLSFGTGVSFEEAEKTLEALEALEGEERK